MVVWRWSDFIFSVEQFDLLHQYADVCPPRPSTAGIQRARKKP